MINRNVADYTNFGGNKTNKRIVQAPGGSSSISLGWENSNNNYTHHQRSSNLKNNYQQSNNNSYGQQQYSNQYQSYEQPMNVMGNNYQKQNNNRNSYEQNNRQQYSKNSNTNNNLIGGQYGYNNYNPITQNNQNYQNNKYPPKNQTNKYYQQKNDPNYFYKQSGGNYKNVPHDQLDMALQQHKHKVQSSRSQRNHGTSNSLYQNQQSNNDSKPCVKIHQQKNNDIFGNNYDYWRQDGHSTKNSAQNNKKQTPYLYERNNQYTNQNKGYQQYSQNIDNSKNQKTSVKVHNPPGGKTNFTFG